MTRFEIIEELKKLSLEERLAIVEATLHQIREDMRLANRVDERPEKKRRLTEAAQALAADYETNGELTAFTVLDSEEFHD